MNVAFSELIIETSSDSQAGIDHMFDKGSALLEEHTMMLSCKNDRNDPTPERFPSSRHLNPVDAILQQRDGYWVGPELGVTTYRICWRINIHKRVNKLSENIRREADYTVITQLCFSLAVLLCDSSLIVL